jgi:hypothetical protein
MKLTSLIKLFAFSLLLLGVPAVASAQWGGNNGGYGNGNRNGGYNNGDLKYTIQRVKDQARNFERSTDNYGYGNIENLADDFKRAADRLEDKFGNGRNMNNSYDAANRLVQLAQQIDRNLQNGGNNRNGGYGSGRNGGNGSYEWGQIRNDVRQIADAYNIRYNNGGWNNGNNNRRGNGNNNRRISIPWPF